MQQSHTCQNLSCCTPFKCINVYICPVTARMQLDPRDRGKNTALHTRAIHIPHAAGTHPSLARVRRVASGLHRALHTQHTEHTPDCIKGTSHREPYLIDQPEFPQCGIVAG